MDSLPHTVLLVAMMFFCSAAHVAKAQEYPRLAPYSAIQWPSETAPEIKLNGATVALVSINDIPVAEIIGFAQKKHGDRWKKRFNEDLVQVLTEMGKPPGATVKLVVKDASGAESVHADVPMTERNRNAIRDGQRETVSRGGPRRSEDKSRNDSPADMHRAVDDFESAINARWSYRHTNDADFASAIKDVRARIDQGISIDDLGFELQKIIALGIDGHAEVSGFDLPRGACLPFLVEPGRGKFVAFREDRSAFLADGYPHVTRIDGVPVADWCATAATMVPRGSPQYVRRQCLRQLRQIDVLRRMRGLPQRSTVDVELSSADGSSTKAITMPAAEHPATYGEWPPVQSRLLDGNIGYLRLPSMDPRESVEEIERWMPKFRETDGVIVDVRDNGGGARDALLLLYSHFAAPGSAPRVISAARYRLHESHGEDHLAQRFMFRANAPVWKDAERAAVRNFAETFKPKWTAPEGQFSDWHYLVLDRQEGRGVFHYDKPVVVLLNAKCFSATDIFLAGLRGLPNVTLMGEPSGGGSARAQEVPLGATRLKLRIGSMVSYQADGSLFDGHGVQPDVLIEHEPEYYIGGRDNVLQAAMESIRKR